jgi:para-nitrobenzyl esterase
MKSLKPILACFASALVFTAVGATAGTPVKIDSGAVSGSTSDGVESFKGIPFAAPPLGDLRWRAPQPVTPWTGVRDSTQFGHDCMQTPFGGDAAPLGATPAEDCLVASSMAARRPRSMTARPLPARA